MSEMSEALLHPSLKKPMEGLLLGVVLFGDDDGNGIWWGN